MSTGGTVGTIGGATLGTAFGGPLGGAVGGYLGNKVGNFVGGLFGGGSSPDPQAAAFAAYQEQIRQQQLAAYQQQQQLAAQLRAQSLGQGPSVAGMQLGAGLEAINRGTASQAAGVGGEGGVLARYAAINGAANAGAAANQSGALARTTEEANAQHELGGVLNNESGTAANIYGTNVSGGNQAAANQIAKTKNEEEFGLGTVKLLGGGLNGGAGGAAAASSMGI